jgi:hypothetical protein
MSQKQADYWCVVAAELRTAAAGRCASRRREAASYALQVGGLVDVGRLLICCYCWLHDGSSREVRVKATGGGVIRFAGGGG